LPIYPSRNKHIDGMIAMYRRANPDIADTRYGLASAFLMKGDFNSALSQLREDEPSDRFEPFILRGEAARQSGDLEAARSLFNDRTVKLAGEKAVEWAWNHLYPAPIDSIEIGSGLDLGYVRGFYGPEVDKDGRVFRWTVKEAEIRNLKSTDSTRLYPLLYRTVTWSGWRPVNGKAEVSDHVSSSSVTLPNNVNWQTQTLPLRGWEDATLSTNPFVPGGSDPRLLGIRISRVFTTDE